MTGLKKKKEKSFQFSSDQFEVITVLSAKPTIHVRLTLREVSQRCLSNSSSVGLSDYQWPSLVLSRKSAERFLFLRLYSPGDRWCEVLSFVPADSVSSSTTLNPIFRDPYATCEGCFARQYLRSFPLTPASPGQ